MGKEHCLTGLFCMCFEKSTHRQVLGMYLKLHLVFHLRYLSTGANSNPSIAKQLTDPMFSCSCLSELLKEVAQSVGPCKLLQLSDIWFFLRSYFFFQQKSHQWDLMNQTINTFYSLYNSETKLGIW